MTYSKLPDVELDYWRYASHETVLPRIFSSPESRRLANTYIYRQPYAEKLILTKILNDWNRSYFTEKVERTVIRPEAVPIIKHWLHLARDYEVAVARRLFRHLQEQREKDTNNKQRPSTSAAEYATRGKYGTAHGLEQRPHTTYAPYSNRSSMFNTVRTNTYATDMRDNEASSIRSRSPKGDHTEYEEAEKMEESRPSTQESFSSVQGRVIEQEANDTELASKDNTLSELALKMASAKRPVTAGLHPPPTNTSSLFHTLSGTRQGVAKEKQSYNGLTKTGYLHELMQKQKNIEKFSANFQRQQVNTGNEEPQANNGGNKQRKGSASVKANHPPRSPSNASSTANRQMSMNGAQAKMTATFFGAEEAHRDIGLKRHYPGRYYYPSQIFF